AVRRLARAEQPPRAHAALLRRAARAAGLRSGPRRRGARAGRRAAGAAARSVRPAADGVRRRARAARRSAPPAFTRRRLRRRARRPASLPGWRKGRRRGLKLPGPDRPLWVRLPPRAPCARRAPRAVPPPCPPRASAEAAFAAGMRLTGSVPAPWARPRARVAKPGIRRRLKIFRPRGHVGSIPTPGTTLRGVLCEHGTRADGARRRRRR